MAIARGCRICGRPLLDPVSLATGVGRSCAHNARAARHDPELFNAAFFSEIVNGVLVVFDRDCGTLAVAHGAAAVLRSEVAARGTIPKCVIYRDSNGHYGRLLHRRGVFGGIQPLGAASLADALAAVA
jgi:hypothetical protein